MATKSDKRQVRGLIEGLEFRVHRGPPVRQAEVQSMQELLRQRGFSPTSEYFNRLTQLTNRLRGRTMASPRESMKHNYGGSAGGRQMQVQSVFDHVILSTCYDGFFNGKRGRVKISHRFNQEGRVDFVELKFLRSLYGSLNGELRKLLMIKAYQSIRKDWLEAEAVALRVLPQELIFLYENVFQSPREHILAWLVNIGHRITGDLFKELKPYRFNGSAIASCEGAGGAGFGGSNYGAEEASNVLPWLGERSEANEASDGGGNGGAATVCVEEECAGHLRVASGQQGPQGGSVEAARGSGQLPLTALADDEVALPILEKVACLESAVEYVGEAEVVVRYVRTGL